MRIEFDYIEKLAECNDSFPKFTVGKMGISGNYKEREGMSPPQGSCCQAAPVAAQTNSTTCCRSSAC